MTQFSTSILIKDIRREKVLVDIKIWIRDFSKRNDIVPGYQDPLRLRFAKGGIEFRDDRGKNLI